MRSFVYFLTTFIAWVSVWADAPPVYDYTDTRHPVIATQGMVAARERIAAEAGLAILQQGGNAIDAAVVTGFCLAVTLPQAGNIGGGGFMLVHHAESGRIIALDYREKAPLAATRDMYLDAAGNVVSERSRYSHLAAGVPGTVAGFAHALEAYGTLSLAEALQPAIQLAEEGFPVGRDLYASLVQGKSRLLPSKAAMATFYDEEGNPHPPGALLRQPVLAETLKTIAEEGAEAFYTGEIAETFASYMQKNGALITMEDLAAYEPVEREPVKGTYRGYEIASMPPPSSGGAHIVQMLNVLESFDVAW